MKRQQISVVVYGKFSQFDEVVKRKKGMLLKSNWVWFFVLVILWESEF